MSNEKKELTRRQALSTMGKAAAATVIGAAALNTEALAISDTESRVTTISFVVGSYTAYLHSAPQYSWESRIIMFSNPMKFTYDVLFIKEGRAIPANTVDASGVYAKVHFPASRFMEVRDFLRYEKPVRVTLVGTNGIATISTNEYELIGDHDI